VATKTSDKLINTNTYINSRPLHITFIETNQLAQVHNRQLEVPSLPTPPQLATPKNEPNPENQLNPHTLLPTIGMILPIAGGSTMEFQTKKQKKDHLRLANNITV
jgi:PhoPQ-activated pathogenicity-related protein